MGAFPHAPTLVDRAAGRDVPRSGSRGQSMGAFPHAPPWPIVLRAGTSRAPAEGANLRSKFAPLGAGGGQCAGSRLADTPTLGWGLMVMMMVLFFNRSDAAEKAMAFLIRSGAEE